MRNYCKRDKEFDIAFYAHISNDFTDGHRGEAKARRGAKKFINSRMRFHQKMKLKDIEDD